MMLCDHPLHRIPEPFLTPKGHLSSPSHAFLLRPQPLAVGNLASMDYVFWIFHINEVT